MGIKWELNGSWVGVRSEFGRCWSRERWRGSEGIVARKRRESEGKGERKRQEKGKKGGEERGKKEGKRGVLGSGFKVVGKG